MKNFGKLAVLGAVLAASSSFAFADVISLGSYGVTGLSDVTGLTTYAPSIGPDTNTAMQYVGSETYGSLGAIPATPGPLVGQAGTAFTTTGAGPAVDLDPKESPTLTVWGGPVANSSWVGINANAGPYNTSNPPYGYYEFSTTFTAAGGLYGVTGALFADDSTAIYLNGVLLYSLLPNQDQFVGAPKVFSSGSLNLLSGMNTLTFVVEQTGDEKLLSDGYGDDPTGIDFDATLTQTPEPSSLMLLGTGLVGAAGAIFRHRRVTA